MYEKIKNKEAKIAVIGLGYVGLPIALAFARKASVVGFDIDQERVEMMQQGIDPSHEIAQEKFQGADISFTSDVQALEEAICYIVTVPTPVDEHKVPNLNPVLKASETIGGVLKKGDYVIYESTVYPGCTEDDCVPVLEKVSGLHYRDDFKVGYSPERINPGDNEHTIADIKKVVSGCCDDSLEEIAQLYELVVDAGVHRAPGIKVAEAAKVIENTQRDLNIALMNELAKIFDLVGVNTYDVLDAAGTKWNFLPFYPGLVGGHCIGVDPYYLTYKAIGMGYKPEVILSGRRINDSMGAYVVKTLIQNIIKTGKSVMKTKVLIMGATFKENVSDIRNSRVIDLYNEFKSFSVPEVHVTDPLADSEEVKKEYGFELTQNLRNDYDAVIVAVNHKEYVDRDESYFEQMMAEDGILADIKGIYRGKFNRINYWSL